MPFWYFVFPLVSCCFCDLKPQIKMGLRAGIDVGNQNPVHGQWGARWGSRRGKREEASSSVKRRTSMWPGDPPLVHPWRTDSRGVKGHLHDWVRSGRTHTGRQVDTSPVPTTGDGHREVSTRWSTTRPRTGRASCHLCTVDAPEDVVLSDISQTQDTSCVIPLPGGPQRRQLRRQTVDGGARGGGRGGE